MKKNIFFFESLYLLLAICFPLLVARLYLGFGTWDLTIPLLYGNADHIWQLALNKVLFDTGWVLNNPFLGAPDIASWHHNAAAQTSALHSILELALKPFVQDAVQMQQLYYFLNFPLITVITFYSCRMVGVYRIPALAAGILFSFTRFRIDEMLYTYLPNYFSVPLVVVSTIWIATGKFKLLFIYKQNHSNNQADNRRNWIIWTVGLLFLIIAGLADGYYSFFALMLLGISILFRIVVGDWKKPASLLPGAIYIFTLLAVAIALQTPLNNYKKNHSEEFFSDGVKDEVYVRKPFEAEVYSSSLKLLLAPNQHHRIEALASLGQQMVSSSDHARKYERGNYWPLGLLASIILLVTLFRLVLPKTHEIAGAKNTLPVQIKTAKNVLPLLILFSFLASIAGGLGTMVALVFPTIRAYDRFPVYLFLLLLISGANLATSKLATSKGVSRFCWTLAIILIAFFALLDQIPADAYKGDESTKEKFVSERRLVNKIELALPANSMVYQYPYSQYLRESKYYGWGSFAHVRLYLHSKTIRWSNGGAKNSPADDWHFRTSQLAFKELLAEIEALGFKGLVIDRSVVKDDEYDTLKQILLKRGDFLRDDPVSKLAFVELKDAGVLTTYQPDYKELLQVTVTNPAAMQAATMPRLIESDAIKKYLKVNAVAPGTVLTKVAHPELFINSVALMRGLGDTAILPITDMIGEMRCAVRRAAKPGGGAEVVLTLINLSNFDWKLNQGAFPLRVGVHIRQADGTMLVWDNGFRTTAEPYIKRGASQEITVALNTIPMSGSAQGAKPDMFEFEFVQDGNAWFNKISCRTPSE